MFAGLFPDGLHLDHLPLEATQRLVGLEVVVLEHVARGHRLPALDAAGRKLGVV